MKAIFPILLCLIFPCTAIGQGDEDTADLADKVEQAIQEFNGGRDAEKEPEKEVAVVLPPPEPESEGEEDQPAVAIPVEEIPAGDNSSSETAPTIATGTTPEEEPVEQALETEVETAVADAPPPVEAPPGGGEGLGIRVEPIRNGKGGDVPGEIKLKASFPAKTLATTPDGWILEKSDQAPEFIEEVTLRPGKKISLNISPHVLTPAADGKNTFAVVEPGFDPAEGYRQSNTVSAILGNSVAQLDRDSLLLGNAITELHQLLASLPKPEPEPEPEESLKP